MFRLGKKVFPSPDSPRTGMLPRMQGKTEIGNKTLLRATDKLLGVENVAGTPALLQNTEVVPVVDIGRGLGWNPSRVIIYSQLDFMIGGGEGFPAQYPGLGVTNPIVLIGSPASGASGGLMFNLDETTGVKLLGAEATVIFGAGPVDNSRLVVQWWLCSKVQPNGIEYLFLKIAGGDISNPLVLDSDTLQYRVAISAPNSGGDGSAGNSSSAGAASQLWNGWLSPPSQNNLQEDTGLYFAVSLEYWDLVGAARLNFPANSSVAFKVVTQRVPVGFMPINL